MADRFLSDVLAAFVIDTRTDAIPETETTWVKHLMLDAIGNAYAATRYEFAHGALTALRGLDEGESYVIGMPARLTVRDSVLMNGILIHASILTTPICPAQRTLAPASFRPS